VTEKIFNRVITLTNATLTAFLECAKIRRLEQYGVAALSVCLEAFEPPGPSDNGFIPNVESLLVELAQLMRSLMRTLKTFSFRIEERLLQGFELDHDPDRITVEPTMLAEPIIALLHCLPDSCVDLELDTSLLEKYRKPQDHFCPYIAAVMPRLCHLRLRIRHICCNFIGLNPRFERILGRDTGPIAPRLRSLVINLESPTWIPTVATACPGSPATFGGIVHLHIALGLFLFECHHSEGRFPSMEKLEVHAGIPLQVSNQNRRALRQSDITRMITRIHAYYPVPSKELYPVRPMSWRAIRTYDDRDIIGPFGQSREILEDAWASTTLGCRFPITSDRNRPSVPVSQLLSLRLLWEPLPCDRTLKTYMKRQARVRRAFDPELRLLEKIDFDNGLKCWSFRTLREIPDDFIPRPLSDTWSHLPSECGC
jgi:hypothetical protein